MTRNDTKGGEDMRLLTKAEACRELRMSLSTLNRRIAAGEVPVDGSHAEGGTGCT